MAKFQSTHPWRVRRDIVRWGNASLANFNPRTREGCVAVLDKAEQKSLDLRLLLRTFREMTDIKKLTPTLVNSLIERIEVHNNDKSSGHCYVKVDIYFTAVGMFKIPTEDEIIIMMEEIRKNPHEYRFVA